MMNLVTVPITDSRPHSFSPIFLIFVELREQEVVVQYEAANNELGAGTDTEIVMHAETALRNMTPGLIQTHGDACDNDDT